MDRVLVAFDGSKPAVSALEYAFGIAPDAEFTVCHPLDIDRSESPLSDAKSVLRWLRSSEGHAEEVRDLVDEKGEQYGVTATTEPVVGKVTKRIVEHSESGEFDHIFVGNHSRSERGLGLFANITERIVRRATIPVTAVGDSGEKPFETPPKSVLVPVDGSRSAFEAIDFVCRHFPEANITALNVIDPLVVHLDALETSDWSPRSVEKWTAEVESHREEVASLAQSLQTQSESVLNRARNRAADHGKELSLASANGWPVNAILQHVSENGIDHVCMGSHGRSGYERFILGSTTESVLEDCPVPVTTIRRSAKDDA